MKIADWATKLKKNYLFQSVSEKTKKFLDSHQNANLKNMGIGDVTLPLSNTVVDACIKASKEMGSIETFRGYSPNGGWDFLKIAIQNDYLSKGISIDLDEIFISDGAKSDMSNILDLFSSDNTCFIPDPVYPVYLDTCIMNGMRVEFINATYENDFLPMPDQSKKADIIYICSPNNPTGATYSKDQMQAWVDYANSYDSVILYDAAYEAFVDDNKLCRSIFEVKNSEYCSIEFKSFSKSAGFTGMRCGYSIVSKKLVKDKQNLNSLWSRRHSTKFNGVPYIIQRAAEASLSDQGKIECQKCINKYKKNAKKVMNILKQKSIEFFGGENSPYIWMKCPNNMNSWEYFNELLENKGIVSIPGSGFGKNGEGFVRLSAFCDINNF